MANQSVIRFMKAFMECCAELHILKEGAAISRYQHFLKIKTKIMLGTEAKNFTATQETPIRILMS